MIILMEVKAGKDVTYFDIPLNIPKQIKYLATDADGMVWGYEDKPRAIEGVGVLVSQWVNATDRPQVVKIGEVDLQGLDWRDTLREYE